LRSGGERGFDGALSFLEGHCLDSEGTINARRCDVCKKRSSVPVHGTAAKRCSELKSMTCCPSVPTQIDASGSPQLFTKTEMLSTTTPREIVVHSQRRELCSRVWSISSSITFAIGETTAQNTLRFFCGHLIQVMGDDDDVIFFFTDAMLSFYLSAPIIALQEPPSFRKPSSIYDQSRSEHTFFKKSIIVLIIILFTLLLYSVRQQESIRLE
jgi:hypothetical protein